MPSPCQLDSIKPGYPGLIACESTEEYIPILNMQRFMNPGFMLVGFQLGWPLPPQKRSGVRTREFHVTGVRDAFFKAGCISCGSNGGLLENHLTDFFIAL
jgi:hypothetical protein